MGEKLAINDYGGLGRGHSGAFRGYETSGEVLGVWEDSRASERVLKIGCMLNTIGWKDSTIGEDYLILILVREREREKMRKETIRIEIIENQIVSILQIDDYIEILNKVPDHIRRIIQEDCPSVIVY